MRTFWSVNGDNCGGSDTLAEKELREFTTENFSLEQCLLFCNFSQQF
jgi:hypothetical protein